jgi:regulatory protein
MKSRSGSARKAQLWDEEDGLEKARKYCAWQERCRSEVWTKLLQIGCPRGDVQRLLGVLETEGFLDEGRYARSYARGKFNLKGWGRIKIREALRGKHIPEEEIRDALELIEEPTYGERLAEIARKKLGSGSLEDWETGQKLRAFLEGKGYEWEAIEKVLKVL